MDSARVRTDPDLSNLPAPFVEASLGACSALTHSVFQFQRSKSNRAPISSIRVSVKAKSPSPLSFAAYGSLLPVYDCFQFTTHATRVPPAAAAAATRRPQPPLGPGKWSCAAEATGSAAQETLLCRITRCSWRRIDRNTLTRSTRRCSSRRHHHHRPPGHRHSHRERR